MVLFTPSFSHRIISLWCSLIGMCFLGYTDLESLEKINKIRETKLLVQRRMEFRPAYNFRLAYQRRKW